MKNNITIITCCLVVIVLTLSLSSAIKLQDSIQSKVENSDSHITRLTDNISHKPAVNQTQSNSSKGVPPRPLNTGSKMNTWSWSSIKETLIAYQEFILFNCCSIILLSLLFLLYKTMMPFLHTNNFTEKRNLTSKNIFKIKDPVLQNSNNEIKNQINSDKAEYSQSYDAETGRCRDTCVTILEQRESEIASANQRGSCSKDNNTSSDKGQGVSRRRQTSKDKENLIDEIFDDCEIIPKKYEHSKAFLINKELYSKPTFEDKKDQRAEYYKEREKAIFGNEEIEDNFPNFQAKTTKSIQKKQDNELQNFEIKYNFSENESEDDDVLSIENREIKINENFERQTIDLNGPMYDINLNKRKFDDCISEIGRAESEVEDVKNILNQFENRSCNDYAGSDIFNPYEENNDDIFKNPVKKRNKKHAVLLD